MKHLLYFGGFLLAFMLPLPEHAQDARTVIQAGDAIRSSLLELPLKETINIPSVDLRWKSILLPVPGQQVHEPKAPNDEEIKRLKAQKLRDKLKKEPGFAPAQQSSSTDQTSIPPVSIGRNFQGNTYNYWYPGDNHLAVSDVGYIVSVANGSVIYQDLNGTLLYQQSLNEIVSLDTDHHAFDPVVIYDPEENRFIIVILSLNNDGLYDSEIHVLFSVSSNPLDGWYHYIFPGDYFSNGYWADYPKISLSQNEFMLTVNLFDTNRSFQEALLLQMNKLEGYAGNTLHYIPWHNFSDSPFTLVPVTHGLQTDYGTPSYFVASWSGYGNYIKIYELNGTITQSPTITYRSIRTPYYSVGADGPQLGTSVLVDVGNCKIQSAIKVGDIIHYVFSSERNNGWVGINYHRLNVNNWSVSVPAGDPWGQDQYDYAYPSIASAGGDSLDQSVVIGFLRSGESIYPEVRYVYVDHEGNFSGSELIKAGEGYLNLTNSSNSTVSRWGDYSGTVRQFNTQAVVWVTGMYGNNQNTWDAWTAEIVRDELDVEKNKVLKDLKVYPNPFKNSFSLRFYTPHVTPLYIFIMDVHGKKVADLYKGKSYAGENVFRFDPSSLSSGNYFIIVKSLTNIIAYEKIAIC